MKSIPRIDQDDFDSGELMGHKDMLLTIFSADWCPYCISFFNNWAEYSKVDNVLIADITDVESKLWDDFSIEVVPTMIAFDNGMPIKRWDGQLQRGLTINEIESVNSFFLKS